jgi:hypothetical protein
MAKHKKKFLQAMKSAAPFDMFGISPSFFIKGEEKQVTFIGCVCTVLMISLLGVVSFFYLWQFFDKANVQTTSTTVNSKTFPEYDLNSNKFFVSITFRVDGKIELPTEIEKNYLTIKAFFVELDQTDFDAQPVTVRTELFLEPCDALETDITDIHIE